MTTIDIVGAGLAGCEAALQLANRGISVNLYDIKPHKKSAAHHSEALAEIVCSNSFGSHSFQAPDEKKQHIGAASVPNQNITAASALIKQEMLALGCELLQIAEDVAVPAGKALAVDREVFSQTVTQRIQNHPKINFIPEEYTQFNTEADFTLFATGPLTTSPLIEVFGQLLNQKQLYFFDAAAPIIEKDSIDFSIAFVQDRYDESEDTDGQSYINCPLEKDEYLALIDKILTAEKIELKDFEKEDAKFFESCLPVEELARRGVETLRYGPMKPVGLTDPRTGRRPYAAVQLRQDNSAGTLYNMVGFQTNLKWGVQKEMIQMIPGLANADVVRYGVMHRNTFINSPEVLLPTLQLQAKPNVFFAGQLTGTEGYTESVATGMFAALNIAQLLQGNPAQTLPTESMLGALLAYITREEAKGQSFQPINSNWGILPPLDPVQYPLTKKKDKPQRNAYYVERALKTIQTWKTEQSQLF
jgi:methylenetetrahydrofolate--tRNA-(uracil-5-)-methyltransferase